MIGIRKWPILPTLLVALAVATMIGLGFWQLQRKAQKEALLAQYAAAADKPSIIYPAVPIKKDAPYFRLSSVNCLSVKGWHAVAGSNIKDEAGFAHIADCQTSGGEGPGARVAIGWSMRPDKPAWQGGLVHGIIAPDNQSIVRLVASEPVAGLQQLARPSIASIANNHLSYAIQWFSFAAIAAIIYILALRRKGQATAPE